MMTINTLFPRLVDRLADWLADALAGGSIELLVCRSVTRSVSLLLELTVTDSLSASRFPYYSVAFGPVVSLTG